MKFFILFLMLFSIDLHARYIDSNYDKEQCYTRCDAISYVSEQYGKRVFCHELMICTIRRWNNDRFTCEVNTERESRKVPLSCRSIPPLD